MHRDEDAKPEVVRTYPQRSHHGAACLRRYLQRFEGGFGLSANIFNALTEKTKTMDVYSRHGGLVIDEIKLSEHLNHQNEQRLPCRCCGNTAGYEERAAPRHPPALQRSKRQPPAFIRSGAT
ncbi:hypothetical protein HPB50_025322 [Hyalomma asiaticum]|uniref:Uncharacterized protein n=1 Tax=Hyalomma asiaticum TaxID=266040 RepID=A0ACB7STB5_HYAAI|nr:hypothetical protein HPB50_025322 [Hyalomma asiaticum]